MTLNGYHVVKAYVVARWRPKQRVWCSKAYVKMGLNVRLVARTLLKSHRFPSYSHRFERLMTYKKYKWTVLHIGLANKFILCEDLFEPCSLACFCLSR